MSGFISNPKIEQYIIQHTTQEDSVLKQLERETFLKVLMPHMISGHEQGVLLEIISSIKQPKIILEIGTFTGYSAICLAKGLQQEGKIICMEKNEELQDIIESAFAKANISNRLDLRIGNAMELLADVNEMIDIVFIDADKQNYSHYYTKVFDKLNTGAIIIADNVLWKGKVIENDESKDTQALREFNTMVQQDERVVNTILPIRDGILLAIKK